tara:strand:+ start:65 stop:319 length:255 start_codon:yes stop_codon:yes gene_type:complete
VIFDGNGDDVLLGGIGDDQVNGGSVVDTLDGDLGNDTLKSYRGADDCILCKGNDAMSPSQSMRMISLWLENMLTCRLSKLAILD